MENLNAEMIKKALECCENHEGDNCPDCPYHYTANGFNHNCKEDMCADAISLVKSQKLRIKELTEENERLRGVGIPDNEVYIRLSDAKHAIMEYACNRTVSQYASAEICKAVRNGVEGAMNELDYITPVKVAPIANTVRKMQWWIKEQSFTYKHLGEIVYVEDIDHIADEMAEGKDDNA